MPESFIKFKAVVLKNNCPQCYSKDGLRLTFKQKVVETPFYKSITSEIHDKLSCKVCNSTIYPIDWTDDIERVVAYQRKAFTPKKPLTSIKSKTWLLVGAALLLIGSLLFWFTAANYK